MVTNDKAFLKAVEGYELDPYKDSKGLLTVGVGHLLERRYSPDEVERFLDDDIRPIRERLERLSYWPDLSPARRCVCLSVAFNVGWDGFLKFRKMRAALSHGDYSTAAAELLNSKRSREDIGRWRSDVEYQMLLTGEWQEF